MRNFRTLKSILAIAILVVTLFTFCGCDIILQYLGMQNQLTITAEYNGETIYVGDQLDTKDITVTATFVNGISGEQFSHTAYGFQVSALDTSTDGEKTLQITYTESGITATCQLTITVVKKPAPVSISATYNGTSVAINGELKKSDFSVEVVYDNNTTEPANDFALSSIDTSTSGEKIVTVTYTYLDGTIQKTLQTTVKVQVLASLSTISATFVGAPLQVGEQLTSANLIVQEVYTDRSTKTIDYPNYTFTSVDTSTTGSKSTTITYNKNGVVYTATANVIVADNRQLTSISARFANPSFHVGDTLTTSDFVVTATYEFQNENSQIDTVTTTITDFQIDQTTFATEGKVTVTISYTFHDVTKTCTVDIDVLPQGTTLTRITAEADVLVFQLDDQLANTNFVVTAYYSDGTFNAVSDFVITSPADKTLSTSGEVKVVLSYTYKNVTRTTTIIISVIDNTPNYGKYGILSDDGKSVKITDTAKVVDTTNLQIHFLELGNQYTGDCTYIKAGDTDILIDAGSRKDSAGAIANYVDRYCTDGTLEYVIVTHAHQDHIAGFVGNSSVKGIFEKYKCENIIDFPKYNTASQISKDYLSKRSAEIEEGANHYTALECWNNNNQSSRFNQSTDATGARRYIKLADNLEMEILYNHYYENNTSNENDYSVCVMINQYGENYDFTNVDNPENEKNVNHFLFTGDLEESGESYLVTNNNLPEVVLFKGGHHGSYTATSDALLNVIKPKVVCICCCTGTQEFGAKPENTFPAQAMINRVAKHTDLVFATSLWVDTKTTAKSLNGNITLTCNNLGVNLTASNNVTMLKDTQWFKDNRNCPSEWK